VIIVGVAQVQKHVLGREKSKSVISRKDDLYGVLKAGEKWSRRRNIGRTAFDQAPRDLFMDESTGGTGNR